MLDKKGQFYLVLAVYVQLSGVPFSLPLHIYHVGYYVLLLFLIFLQSVSRVFKDLGPVVQSFVSLTNSLKVSSLTILADSIYNILIFFAEKCE